jgi:hemerythrin-like metal-binding protein
MSKLLSWNAQFSVGVPEIDVQHQRIVALINELYDAIESGESEAAVNRTLHALVDYTQTHFLFEERLMREAGYPDYADHVAMHEGLVLKVADLAEMNRQDGSVKLGNVLIGFLYDWLTHHILEHDKLYVPYLKQAQVSASPQA